MKSIKKTLLFISLMSLALLACDKEKYCAEECYTAIGINGEWIWVESTGGLAGHTITPATEGFSQRIVIDDFVYKGYVNDSLTIETQYELELVEATEAGGEETVFIRFESGSRQRVLILDTELRLEDVDFTDGYSHYYRRN